MKWLLALLVLSLPGLFACSTDDPGRDVEVPEEDSRPALDAGVPDLPQSWETPPADLSPAGQEGTVPAGDGPVQKKDGPIADYTSPAGPFPKPASPTTVAAVQYGSGQAGLVKASCTSAPIPDICALKELIVQARTAGASLVVLPEAYELDLPWIEATPSIGDNPSTDPNWPQKFAIKTFSYQAKQLGITLIISTFTFQGSSTNPTVYNTQIAFGPDGAVLDLHHKFNLFGKEPTWITPGTDVSVFTTALGKLGMLICADIYGSTTLRSKLANTLGARVVAISSTWTTSNPMVSYYTPYAKKWGVYAIVGNTTNPGYGYGGGIIAPDGTVIAQWNQPKPGVVTGTIPLP